MSAAHPQDAISTSKAQTASSLERLHLRLQALAMSSYFLQAASDRSTKSVSTALENMTCLVWPGASGKPGSPSHDGPPMRRQVISSPRLCRRCSRPSLLPAIFICAPGPVDGFLLTFRNCTKVTARLKVFGAFRRRIGPVQLRQLPIHLRRYRLTADSTKRWRAYLTSRRNHRAATSQKAPLARATSRGVRSRPRAIAGSGPGPAPHGLLTRSIPRCLAGKR